MKQILIRGNHRKQNLYTTSHLNTSDTGRSMTEMLGTLAIIGVLSIIGITGYRFAMNQYQANSIAHELNLLRNELQIQMANGNEKLFLGIPYDSETVDAGHLQYNESYGFSYDCGDGIKAVSDCRDEANIYMETKNIPSKICKSLTRLIENLPELESLSVNEVEDGECDRDTNDILFVFGADVILDSRDLPTDYCRKHEDCDEKKPMCEENMCKACPIETPAWNGSSCTTCLNTDPTKPAWNGERCVSCPTETTWNAENEKCESGKWECRTNEECKKGEYCYIYQGYNCSQEFSSDSNSSYYSGTCRNALNDLTKPKIDTHYITSNNEMTYQSAQRFCQALGKNMISVEDLKCAHRICASGCDAKAGYCHKDTSTDVSIASSSNISSVVAEIKKAYPKWNSFSWTNTKYDSCHTYILVTDAATGIWGNGYVYNNDRGDHGPRFPMCQ